MVRLLPWRIEKLSRLFSAALRHEPEGKQESHRNAGVNGDGSRELYEALTVINHAPNVLGN